MSTYHLPGKGIPAALRRAAGLPPPGGSRKAVRSFYDVIRLAQVAVKVYRDMLRSEVATSPEHPADSPTEVDRLRQRSDKVWLALGLVGRDLVTDPDSGADIPTEEELRQVMLEELRRGILERLDRIIQTLQRWLNLYALFLARFFFFEYPNNLRHLCTTMPWSIWPALVVLWGVCWMFYNPEAEGRGQEPELPQQTFSQITLPQATLGIPTSSAPVGGSTFPPWGPMDFSTPGQLRVDTGWGALSSGPNYPSSVHAGGGQWSGTVSPVPNYPSNVHAGGGQWAGTTSPAAMLADSTFAASQPMSQAPMALPIRTNGEVAALDVFDNHHMSLQRIPTPQPAQEIKSHMAPTAMGMPLTPPPGPAGHGNLTGMGEAVDFQCRECNARPFKTANDLKKHSDRHKRRFKCPRCERQPFGSSTDLARHLKTVHRDGGQWYCPELGCNRQGNPFNRKDNFVKHMRDVHKRQGFSARAPSSPSAEGMTERQDTVPEAETQEGRGACGCNAQRENEVLHRDNKALRAELDVLRRKKEAKKAEFQEKEREFKEERKRLWAMLERAVSARTPQVSPPGPSPSLH